MRRRVVITGMGLVSPLGNDLEKVWLRLCNGESGIVALPDEIYHGYRSRIAGVCSDFDPEARLNPKEAKRMDRFSQMALAAALDAVDQSGIDFSKEAVERTASIVGCGVGGLREIEVQQDRLRDLGFNKVMPLTIPKIMLNAASSLISIYYGIHGPSYGVSTACASANNAMIDSLKMIRDDEVDLAITGGTEAAVCQLGLSGFGSMHALSERNDEPEKASRPFDKNRDGFVIGEGAGILVFEELDHAKKRGAQILGEVLGYGVSSDASHITQPDDQGIYASHAIKGIFRSSGLNPDQFDYINAHGTSTKLGDPAETNAIKQAFGDHARKLSISSTKSAIGHLLGGSGGVELIFSLLTIRDGIIPPTLNLEEPDPDCDLDFTPLAAKEKKIETAISNSFGFGGHNACIAVGRFKE
ncbi:MAG: beta-ketoacyl-ACP synthase II [Planctomycetia bacterium]|nr:beta-ketoacyl-ACP synthase II [Planctomycetia bacterium]